MASLERRRHHHDRIRPARTVGARRIVFELDKAELPRIPARTLGRPHFSAPNDIATREKFGRDSIWEAHLAGELWHTNVPIQAILDTIEMPLRQVLEWQVGTRIALNATVDSDVRLVCGDLQMFIGRMGRKSGSIAVRVSEKIEKGSTT